ARTVADAALLLGAMTGVDADDRATRASRRHARGDYAEFLSAKGLEGARLGVPRAVFFERLAAAETPVMDAALRALGDLGAIVVPGWSGAAIGAKAGYPSVIVAAGYTAEGTPIGLTFLGRAWSEPTLLRLAHAFETATSLRRPPPSVAPGPARPPLKSEGISE